MDELLAEGLGGQGSNGIWEAPHVSRRRDALLSKGAGQGWLISDRDLRLGRIIGAGTFGQTYEADWHGVKVLAPAAGLWSDPLRAAQLLCLHARTRKSFLNVARSDGGFAISRRCAHSCTLTVLGATSLASQGTVWQRVCRRRSRGHCMPRCAGGCEAYEPAADVRRGHQLPA